MKEGKSAILGSFRDWYRYQNRVVPVPLMQRPNGIGTIQSGIGTTHQNMNGTGTDAVPLFPAALVSCIFTLLSPNSYTDSIGTLINE